MHFKLYKTTSGILIEADQQFYRVKGSWDELVSHSDLYSYLETAIGKGDKEHGMTADTVRFHGLQAPIGSQEVWAAGVTYLRSRDARMEESKQGGGADCYEKVYDAERPELFFKALPHRVAASGEAVFIRSDSKWNVPEPEFTLYINPEGVVQGYTIGNDMSSRDIEGENPLYLPQAKVYERSAALGPCLYVPGQSLSKDTRIEIEIRRQGAVVFQEAIALQRMKRSFEELAAYLFRGCDFRQGVYLMTGTGMVPPSDFTLQAGDLVRIRVPEIGVLENEVAVR